MSHINKNQLESNIAIVDLNTAKATTYFENYLYDISLVADAVSDVTSADATDLASAITLVNEIKTQLNALLTNLRESRKLND